MNWIQMFLVVTTLAAGQVNGNRPPTLEGMRCNELLALMEDVRAVYVPDGVAFKPMEEAVGWWGRGIVEGSLYAFAMARGGFDPNSRAIADADNKLVAFGLSTPVVSAHIATYCRTHPSATAVQAAADLVLKVMR